MKKLTMGCFYTVTEGRFKGITGIATEAIEGGSIHCLESIDLPDDGVVSFLGSFHSLRKATASEELSLRRRMDN